MHENFDRQIKADLRVWKGIARGGWGRGVLVVSAANRTGYVYHIPPI